MTADKQMQKAGDNSQSIQAGTINIYNGIDEKRARERCAETYAVVRKGFTAELITRIADINQTLGLTVEQYIVVHGQKGEIPVPADMVLSAKEKKLTTLYLYSKENGLIEKSVDEILGTTYGNEIIQKAEELAKKENRSIRETCPIVINQYLGDVYHGVSPDTLIAILDRLIQQNQSVNQEFVDHLLSQLRASDDETAKKAADQMESDTKSGKNIFKALKNAVTTLPKLAAGAKTTLVDGKAAWAAAVPIWNALQSAAMKYGPDIMELFSKLPPQ